jgi:streptomycin 6-kinase
MKRNDWRSLEVPQEVRLKAQALGPPGLRWLHGLPDLTGALAREWGLTMGTTLSGGSAAYVAAVTTADGTDAVLKVHMPGYDSVASEIKVLQIAGGRGYVRLLRHDEARGVMLQERLGQPLSELGLPVTRQMEIICATLERAWVRSPEAAHFPSGAWKARWLRSFITETWQALDRPCSERVIDQALAYGVSREAAFDPDRSVLVHGDAHSANTLAPLHPGTAERDGFKFVDPDGLLAERACDLAALMRDWSEELLAGDPVRLGKDRCAYLSTLTGEDPEAIWQWGFIERVSTGLLLLQTGSTDEGRDYLRVAEAWARA